MNKGFVSESHCDSANLTMNDEHTTAREIERENKGKSMYIS